jgi:branched-chain amino acid aminotransferase
MKIIWQNGQLVPFATATTHVMSHGLHYGSGVFEGIRAYHLASGETAVFALPEHLERMYASAKPLGMHIPYSRDELSAAITSTIRANGYSSCYIRPLAYYGNPSSGVRVRPAMDTPVEVIIACYEMGNYLPDTALDVLISDVIRIHPRSSAVGAKICGHYVNSLQALLAIDNSKYNEVILLDYEGNVAEGSSENIFVVKGKQIFTPCLGTILTGITRKIIMELAHSIGYQVCETTLKPEELFSADEIFFTGTAVEVRGVGSINDQAIGMGGEGPVTRQIKDLYKQVYRGENPSYRHYLTLV